MIEFTPKRIGVLLELADEKGHANWDLTKKFKSDKGNFIRALRRLEEMCLIEKRGYRKTTNPIKAPWATGVPILSRAEYRSAVPGR